MFPGQQWYLHILVHCSSRYNRGGKWNQPKSFPQTNEWILKMWSICNVEFYFIVKEWDYEIFKKMDRTGKYYTEWGNSGPGRQTPYVLSHIQILVWIFRFLYLIWVRVCRNHEPIMPPYEVETAKYHQSRMNYVGCLAWLVYEVQINKRPCLKQHRRWGFAL